ncbi:MAG: S8 family peptidase, partial [Actinobacteria bacterium]|nr:S8 family peptidase [Actinomycetota bacterium]
PGRDPVTVVVGQLRRIEPGVHASRRGSNGEPRLNNSYGWSASGAGVTAYIVDTGIAVNSAFAAGQVLPGFTSINDGQGTNDCNGHGTHVAGTVASPLYGIAKDAQLVPVRVLDCSGAGSISTVVAGLDFVLQQVAANPQKAARSVVNLSLGGGASSTLDQAVNRLIDSGITVVVAAGNNADNACNYSPARVSRALTVAASDWNDTRASFSNFGSCVDLFAPGQSITSASMAGGALTFSGTSMAAPHVTGAVAQWLQVLTGATPDSVSSALLSASTQNLVVDELGAPDRLLYTAAATLTSPGGDTGTVNPAPIPVSVGGLTGSAVRVTRNGNWRASVEVLIRNSAGSPVGGAAVTGAFTPGGTGLICVTSSNGRCSIASGTLSRTTTQTTFTVSAVQGQGLQYTPSANALSSLRIAAPR